MEVFTRNRTEGRFSSVDEKVSRDQESKRTEETIFVGDGQNSGIEGEFVMCEHIKEIGKEQSPDQVKAPPQKRRAVIRGKGLKNETKKRWRS